MSSLPLTENPKNGLISTSSETNVLNTGPLILLMLAHIGFGALIFLLPLLGTVHAYFVLGLAFIVSLSRPPRYAAYATAYIVGAEVFWRMTGASVFWEIGKYAVVLCLVVSMLNSRQKWIPILPMLYFLLLLPSVFVTLEALGVVGARNAVSFYLSGPFALFISASFFSRQKFGRNELIHIFIALVLPIVSMSVYTMLGTFSNEIVWTRESLLVTSGGFGPNQVSIVAGLGVAALWLLILLGKFPRVQQLFLFFAALIMLIQGSLTFSRGGVYAALLTIVLLTLYVAYRQKRFLRYVSLTIAVALILALFVLPAVNEFTQGYFEYRYTDTSLSGRERLYQEELELFFNNIFAGVGPGGGTALRHAASHTEYSRMLGEHGLFGLASIFLLIVMLIQQWIRSRAIPYQMLGVIFMLWAMFTMANSAMRIVAISYMFGFGFAQLDIEKPRDKQSLPLESRNE